MAKAKFSLSIKPTFTAKVSIPVPGKTAEPVEFTFKGRTKDEFKDFVDNLSGREDVDVIMDIASGWELEDAFDKENVELLTQNYLGAARAIIEKYLSELTQARLGN
jgi:hypothetical protein